MKPSKFFISNGNGETAFRIWLEQILGGQHWHVQAFDDRHHKGIPDICAANGIEAWMELKVSKKIHSVHDYLHLDHPVTAQQHRWLMDRQAKAPGSKCGILVAWRTSPVADPQEYVSYVPIGDWRGRLNRSILMQWALRPDTARVNWLNSGQATILQMLRAELTPGWDGQALSELPSQRPT